MENCLLSYFILNDELRSSCDFNPGLLGEGRGIYEVFRVIDGTPLFLTEHLERYYHSVELAGFTFDLSMEQLKRRMRTLLESNGLKHGNVQFHLTLHPDLGNLFMAWVATHRYPTVEEYEEGVELTSLNAVRNNPHLKSMNLPARLLANELIDKEDVYEVLFVDNKNIVTEGSRSNIFFIKDGKIYTPSLSLVLDGITRSEVVGIVLRNRVGLHNTVIPFDTIGQFDAAFLTSTSMNLLPVRKIDDHSFDPQNQLTRQLMTLFDQRIEEEIEGFKW